MALFLDQLSRPARDPEQFQPGPEFTLYGDGTVIFRSDLGQLPPAEGPIVRAHPFKIAQFSEDHFRRRG